MKDREKLLREVHHANHLGTKALLAQFHRDLVLWPGMQSAIEKYTRSCEICARKGAKRTVEPIRTVVADYPLHHLYINLTFMPKVGRDIGMVNMIDHLTKRIWSKRISSKQTVHVKSFLIATFEGIGLQILQDVTQAKNIMYLRSDNGGEFIAQSIADTCAMYGFIKKEGPAYTPRCQGVIERPNKTIKDLMNSSLLEKDMQEWTLLHSQVINTYNNNHHSTIGMTPMQAWDACFTLHESDLSEAKAALRLFNINQIRNRIIKRGENDAARKISGKRVAKYHRDATVLIRVPKKYRSTERFVWGRKQSL